MGNWGSGFIVIINYPPPEEGPSPGGLDLLTEDGNFIRTETNQKIQTES